MIAQRAPLAIAHRGASAYAAEHTLAAYDMAIAMGADVLEMDVRLTSDGIPVVIHDRTLWRTCLDRRAVVHVTAAELDSFDPAIRPLRLSGLFAHYGTATKYLIDLKGPHPPLERRVAEAADVAGLRGLVQIQSFSRAGIRRARRCAPWATFAQLYPPYVPTRAVLHDLGRVKQFGDAIGPHSGSVDAALVGAAHASGLRVQPYTVNDPQEIARLLALGIDGIISDRPDLARTAIDADAEILKAA